MFNSVNKSRSHIKHSLMDTFLIIEVKWGIKTKEASRKKILAKSKQEDNRCHLRLHCQDCISQWTPGEVHLQSGSL